MGHGLGGILAGARSVARRAGLPAVIPPPGFPALATRSAARAVAARTMAPWGGRALLIRAKLAGRPRRYPPARPRPPAPPVLIALQAAAAACCSASFFERPWPEP